MTHRAHVDELYGCHGNCKTRQQSYALQICEYGRYCAKGTQAHQQGSRRALPRPHILHKTQSRSFACPVYRHT